MVLNETVRRSKVNIKKQLVKIHLYLLFKVRRSSRVCTRRRRRLSVENDNTEESAVTQARRRRRRR